jgi:hypothetical protein
MFHHLRHTLESRGTEFHIDCQGCSLIHKYYHYRMEYHHLRSRQQKCILHIHGLHNKAVRDLDNHLQRRYIRSMSLSPHHRLVLSGIDPSIRNLMYILNHIHCHYRKVSQRHHNHLWSGTRHIHVMQDYKVAQGLSNPQCRSIHSKYLSLHHKQEELNPPPNIRHR